MYAVIQSGGKQYRVTEGDVVRLEKLTAETGTDIGFDKVLMIANNEDIRVGSPYLTNSKVTGTIVAQGRGKKINIIKFRRRKNSMRRQGHRQDFTEVKITAIE